MRSALIAMVILAGCADLGGPSGDDNCTTSLSVTPGGDVEVGSVVTVTAIIDGALGSPVVDWRVRYDQTDPVDFTPNGELEISFTADRTGIYTVDMTPSASGSTCADRSTTINVVMGQPGNDVRLHVTPPIDANVPPIDQNKQLPEGTNTYSLGTVVLDPGRITMGTVGRQAYMRFLPDGQPEAIVETYTDGGGAYMARVQSTPHHILIVPVDQAYPPQVVTTALPASPANYTLTTGVAITGTVDRPNGMPLAGAKVQVFMNDAGGNTVPSTIATSAANGTFTLRSFAATGGNPRVVVTPPAGSGLPRLEASSNTFNFTTPMTVSYGTSIVTRSLSGTTVNRSGMLANAKVTIVGSIPSTAAGTIMAGASVQATGSVRIVATADGNGVLPNTLVPAADLFAVVEPAGAPGDSAVVVFDTTIVVPSAITAPAMTAIATTIRKGAAVLDGARVELVPAGALGLAGVGPTVLYADVNGLVAGSMAAGAIYEMRLSDPSRRGAPKAFASIDAQMVNAMSAVQLDEPLLITGTLSTGAGDNRVDGAGVQILCTQDTGAFACEGVERDRPIGEDASNVQGAFTIAVRPPGS